MSASQGRLAQFVLRYASPLAGLRRVPVLGRCVSWAGAKLVPRDSLAWVEVQKGPAQGLWLHLNPRTGNTYFEGGGEREVQEALQQHLRPGMNFYDIGANIGFFTLLAARLVGKEGRVVAFEADPEIARACFAGFFWLGRSRGRGRMVGTEHGFLRENRSSDFTRSGTWARCH